MRRRTVTRRFAVAILITFAGLLLLALTPLLLHVRVDGDDLRGALVAAFPMDHVTIDIPVRLSSSPAITLVSGLVSGGTSVASRQPLNEPRTLQVTDAVLDVDVGTEPAGTGVAPLVRPLVTQLIEKLLSLDFDKITLNRARLNIRWAPEKSAVLEDVEADVSVKNRVPAAMVGRFKYRGETVVFDVQRGVAEKAVEPEAGRGTRWPIVVSFKSLLLSVAADGTAELGDAFSLNAQTEARTPDLAKLANWLGVGGADLMAGPEILIKGPARWSNGVVAFGRSQISVSDQVSVGAVAISLRDNRPIVEATLAFPALDVAPLLQRAPPGTSAATSVAESAAETGESSVAPPSPPGAAAAVAAMAPWRTLATSFPAVRHVDAEVRLSASRLQWNGVPVGRGAVTLSARAGRLHADLAELDLGAYKGTLQIFLDETATAAPVSLRGRFETADIAPVAAQVFGAPVLRGRAVSQFDIIGRGATLGSVVETASGRGSLEVRDGLMQCDLAALQKIGQAPNQADQIAGWGGVSAPSAVEAFDAKFQVRDGTLFIDQANARNKGIVTSVQGRVGIASGDLDLLVRVGAAGHVSAASRPGLARSITPSSAAPRSSQGDEFAVRGTWSAPLFSSVEPDQQPQP